MAATTTPSTSWLVESLQRDYPSYHFRASTGFQWVPPHKTIEYSTKDFDANLLLHELGHAECGHQAYGSDVELLGLERQAWSQARQIAGNYGISIDQDTIDTHLDSYRDWLHARSTCPDCAETGLQIATNQYSCPACAQKWRVNDARNTRLRRTPLN